MKSDTLLKTGIVGTVIAAICCVTPVLVILFGAVGLSALVVWLDFVLLPALGMMAPPWTCSFACGVSVPMPTRSAISVRCRVRPRPMPTHTLNSGLASVPPPTLSNRMRGGSSRSLSDTTGAGGLPAPW